MKLGGPSDDGIPGESIRVWDLGEESERVGHVSGRRGGAVAEDFGEKVKRGEFEEVSVDLAENDHVRA